MSDATQTEPLLFAENLFLHAENTPEALAVWTPEGTQTYKELISHSKQIAGALQASGCEPGDRIMLICGSSCTAVNIAIASTFVRCIPSPMATSAQADTISLLLDDCKPKVIFVEAAYSHLLETSQLNHATVVIIDGEGPSGMQHWLTVNKQDYQYSQAEDDDILTIVYTSGTTSIPKGMAHSNRARIAFWDMQGGIGNGMKDNAKYGLTTAFYTSGTFQSLLATLYNGGTSVLLPGFDPEQFVSMVDEGLINTAFLVPLQVRRILDSAGFSSDRLRNFRYAMISGSACDQATKQRIIDHWPGMLVDCYGCSETQMLAIDDIKSTNRKPGSVGKVLDYAKVLIIGDNNQPVAIGETGEIVAWTPYMMEEYYNQTELTNAILWTHEDGSQYMRTGDVGHLDDNNTLYVTDRKKDMIVSGGMNLFSADLEVPFKQRDDVADVAVIAIPSERWGETPYAIVVVKPGADVDSGELLSWVNARLDKKAKISGIEFRDSLARNDMQKVSKKELREEFWRGHKVNVA